MKSFGSHRFTVVGMLAFFALTTSGAAENAPVPQPVGSSMQQLNSEVQQLRAVIEQMRAENAQSRSEMQQLRQELQDTRQALAPLAALSKSESVADNPETDSGISRANLTVEGGSENAADLGGRVQRLEESTQLLGSKIDEHYQTKVESAGKYRVRLSGIVLMNTFRNSGASNNLDFPDYAEAFAPGNSHSSLGATLRQTEVGLEIFGPTVAGARTSANVLLDFSGGFPSTFNGVSFGLVRMQTASLRLDWKDTALIAGQDSLFISPLAPTSFASLATPAFAYAGNLWGWTPQLRLEHRFSLKNEQTVSLQGGILDNLNWQPPRDQFFRSAQAGEQSGQPAFAARAAWSRPVFGHSLSFGVAGYYGRQNWSWGRNVDGWAGMADWQIPLLPRLTLSGEYYRGRGVGGLGAGIGRAVVFGGNQYAPSTSLRGLNSAGGWSQLKFQVTPKLELNGVFGEDDAFSGDIRGFAIDANNFSPILGRNYGTLGNVVYRPRSDLLVSGEFRRLKTSPVYDNSSVTNQINLAMGILF